MKTIPKPIPQNDNKHEPLPRLLTSQFLLYLSLSTLTLATQTITTFHLNLNPTQIALTFTAFILPATLLIPAAQTLAQYVNNRTLLIQLLLAATMPTALLAFMILSQNISHNDLLIFALTTGTIVPFIFTAQHNLTPLITSPHQIPHTLKISAQIQSTAILTAIAILGLTQSIPISIGWTILAQSLILALAALAIQRMPPLSSTPHTPTQAPPLKQKLTTALHLAFTDKNLAPTLILIISFSALSLGPALILPPLLIRDYYHSSIPYLTLVNALLCIGMIFTASLLPQQQHSTHKGRHIVIATSTTLFTLLLLSIPGPLWWLCTLATLWGANTTLFLNTAKNIIRNTIPQNDAYSHLPTIYQILVTTSTALGALAFSSITQLTPALHIAPLIPMFTLLITLAIICSFSSLLSAKFEYE